MSRRDTIIIAVLVNAGLLAILFMVAINSEDDKVSDPSVITQTLADVQQMPPKSEPVSTLFAPSSGGDEVDNVLKEYAANPTLLQSDIVEDTPGPSTDLEAPEKDSDSAPVTAPKTNAKDSSDRYVEVTVKRGDALAKIAKANNTTVEAIKKLNNLTSEKISIGQVLRVPVAATTPAKATVEAPKAPATKAAPTVPTAPKVASNQVVAESNVEYYTIKKGDNPWKIAKQFQVKFDDLLKMNNLDEEKARNLKAGDKLRVR